MSVSEAVPPELDVFGSRPFQLAVERYDDVPLSPINTLDITSGVEFYSNGFATQLKSLSEIYLVGTIQLVHAATGATYGQNEQQPQLINNSFLSLFKSCSVYLNRTLVQSQSENFGIIEYINNCLNFSSHSAEAKLSNQGFYSPAQDKELTNQLNHSKQVQMMAKLNILNTDKLLLPHVSLGIKFEFQNPSFYLLERIAETDGLKRAATATKVNLTDVKLYVRHFTIRAPYLLHIESMLSRKYNAIYEYQSFSVVNTTIPSGQSSFSNNSLWNGLKPSLLLLCFMRNKTFVGDINQDPFIFTHNGLSEVSFTVNNEQYPRDSYTVRTAVNETKYARLFASLYNSLGIASENTSTAVTRDSFIERHFFVVQDISGFSSALTTLKDGLEVVNIGFNATFSVGILAPLTALLFLLLPHKIEIDSSRTVSTIY